ncbi:peptidylprolyl isomerase [Paenibacillus sp. HN-1]|uniref:peptidyl-prolyl cis-trans isomerase n=1 Tax=Paenibacillus TaxID=44249 RepID=UPI001CA83D28|nr:MULTISPECIES: peptidyl-prolyl cis-trans isomerase [Paenibacillus]MBY9082542.1 peptidylprolyl isomerase [Paenibacillus sp. CGMCC 1.18879]MBY9086669.1 peptidylprolyl isomerase [Paenibacillus sinensis]
MTRQESALRKAVLILAGLALVLGALLVWQWRRAGKADPNGDGSKTVAKIADQRITEDQWLDELRRKHGNEVLLAMVNRIAAEKEAEALGISVSEQDVDREVEEAASGYDSEEQYYAQMESELGLSKEEVRKEAKYRVMLESIATAGIKISEDRIDEYLQENPGKLHPPKKIELSIIKLASYKEAERAMDRLENGEDFAALAEELSIDEDTRHQGGRVGVVEEDDPFWPQELLTAAAGLEAGDIAGPFQIDEDYAVIRTDKIIIPQAPDEQEVRKQVRRELALEQAPSLERVKDDLRTKYEASISVDKGLQD